MSDFILSLRNISKYYAGHTALDDVSFEVPRGSIYGLLGPNGAGKTTLIRIITQIVYSDAGTILFDDKTLEERHIYQMGYLPEERGLYKKMKVYEQLMYLGRLRGLGKKTCDERVKAWLKRMSLEKWVNKKVERLSKGMQQKIQFIATVIHEPKLIILDEPFSGFDPINANIIQDEILRLKEQGSTVIFSTHRMETVEQLCDHICLIHQSKKILEGPKLEIKNQFRTNTFLLRTREKPVEYASLFRIDSQKAEEGIYLSVLRPSDENIGLNDIIKYLVIKYQIIGIEEILPSVNDIFIQLTTK